MDTTVIYRVNKRKTIANKNNSRSYQILAAKMLFILFSPTVCVDDFIIVAISLAFYPPRYKYTTTMRIITTTKIERSIKEYIEDS